MGLLSEYVETKINNRNRKYYKNLGYDVPKFEGHQSSSLIVAVNDIPRYSFTNVECECDNCRKKYILHYSDYLRRNHNGKIYCQNCCQKVLHSGENNNKWNPNLTDEDRELRRNIPGYTEFTRKVIQRDNYMCQCCGSVGVNLEVHHLNGYNWDKEKRFDFSNVITLCANCHKNFHDRYGRGNNTKEQFESWIHKTIDYLQIYDGELPPSREIICIDDNVIFNSPKEAAEYANSIPSQILKCCLMKDSIKYGQCTKTVHGKHYIYLDDYNKMTQKELNDYLKWCSELKTYKNGTNTHPSSKAVVCVTTKTVFKSGRFASQVMSVSNGGLTECCQHKKEYCGTLPTGEKLVWMYYSEYQQLYNTSDLIKYE